MRTYALFALAALAFAAAAASPDADRWWAHVVFLADDKLEGRNTGSRGHRTAAEYVAQEFERAGLKPAGSSGYFQSAKFQVRQIDESASKLALKFPDGRVEPLTLGEEAYFSLRADLASSLEAPLVFTGFGLTVPEKNYDELAGLDLKGKVAIYLQGGPADIPSALKAHYQSAGERWKFFEQKGAAGLAVFQDPKSSDIPWERARLARFQPAMTLAEPALQTARSQRMSLTLNPAHLDKFFAGTGHTAAEIFAALAAKQPLPKFELKARLIARAAVKRSSVESDNVIGIIPGSDPVLSKEVIVISAHLDHLGIGEPINGDKIYNGALDNGIGVASMIEIARDLKAKGLKRSVAFAAVTAEEKGLLGSKYLAHHPTFKGQTMIANINMDMYLPIHPLKIVRVLGLDESSLGPHVRAAAAALNIKVQGDLQPDRNSFIRSDQYSFIQQGIPAVNLGFGADPDSPEAKLRAAWLKERYHAPSDDLAQPVDKDAAVQFNQLLANLITRIANDSERPRWNDSSFFKRFAR